MPLSQAWGPDRTRHRPFLNPPARPAPASCRDLERVYHDLLRSGAVTAAEFWAARQAELARLESNAQASTTAAAQQRRPASRQLRGLSNSMSADVMPTADGQTDAIHFSLTPEIITQVGRGAERGLACDGGLGRR